MSEKMIIEQCKAFLLGSLSTIDAGDLQQLIRTHDFPPVYEIEIPKFLGGIKTIIKNNMDKILPYLTYDAVMEHGVNFRPDLLVVLKSEEGRRWFKAFLKIVDFTLRHIELTPLQRTQLFFKKIKQNRDNRIKSEVESQDPIQDMNENVSQLQREKNMQDVQNYSNKNPLEDMY